MTALDADGLYYNPQFCEVERVISRSVVPAPPLDDDETDSNTDSEHEVRVNVMHYLPASRLIFVIYISRNNAD